MIRDHQRVSNRARSSTVRDCVCVMGRNAKCTMLPLEGDEAAAACMQYCCTGQLALKSTRRLQEREGPQRFATASLVALVTCACGGGGRGLWGGGTHARRVFACSRAVSMVSGGGWNAAGRKRHAADGGELMIKCMAKRTASCLHGLRVQGGPALSTPHCVPPPPRILAPPKCVRHRHHTQAVAPSRDPMHTPPHKLAFAPVLTHHLVRLFRSPSTAQRSPFLPGLSGLLRSNQHLFAAARVAAPGSVRTSARARQRLWPCTPGSVPT